MRDVHYLYCDALMVRAVVAKNRLGRILVDNESSVNVIFMSTYEHMNIVTPLALFPKHFYGFMSDCITPKRIVCMDLTMEEEPLIVHIFMEFLAMDRRSAYHGVLGQLALKEL
ncbi:Uncharacterized protein Adt_03213 [Abeliophyllum distichum]|uniref:Uncharacterized protein n=1 Tax=Abeliophyllum distichum TaxID=126358 RepID=A0ABD1VXV9_9LAMI